MRGTAPRPVRFYLALLVAAILLPICIFSLVLVERNARAQRENLALLAGATAGSISQAVDQELRGMLTTMRVLASSTSLAAQDYEGFHHWARSALEGSGAHAILLDRADRQILNTRVDYGTPLGPTSDPSSTRAARAVQTPIVSDVFFGQTAQRWVFNLVLPLGSGEAQQLLLMTRDAGRMRDILAQDTLRGGWNVSLLDNEGMVIASSSQASQTGKQFFLGPVTRSGSYAGRTDEAERSREYDVVVDRSEFSDWRVVVWAPSSVIDAPLTATMRTLGLGILAVVLFASIAAWLLGRQISAPIRRLARDAGRLGAGEEVWPLITPVAEISTVSQAMARASADRRAAENEIRFLMREVAHRSKNQLSVVASMAKQSARNADSLAAFQDSFQKRLLGLARSTDLLVAGGVAGVELSQLLEAQLEPFRPPEPVRVDLDGPAFRMGNQAAQTIGLAAHELATNAAKYGAFATAGGRLSVRWKIADGTLDIVWREHVPALDAQPERRGFGTEVIERMLGRTLDAGIERTMHEDGLEYRFTIPLDKIGQQPPQAGMPGPSGE